MVAVEYFQVYKTVKVPAERGAVQQDGFDSRFDFRFDVPGKGLWLLLFSFTEIE